MGEWEELWEEGGREWGKGEGLALEGEKLQSRMQLGLLRRFCDPALGRTGCLGANGLPMKGQGPWVTKVVKRSCHRSSWGGSPRGDSQESL